MALVLLAGCAGGAPPVENSSTKRAEVAKPAAVDRAPMPSTSDVDKWKRRATDAACGASLNALVSGELASFRGLASCGRVDAESALGSSGDAPSKFEQFGEYRVYPHAGGSVMVWFLADDIRVMQLLYPKLPRPLESQLGKPEAKAKSNLSPEWDQWIWASRGLSAHVKRGSGEVISLFAYKPSSVDAFLQTDIARVSKSEAPLEELK